MLLSLILAAGLSSGPQTPSEAPGTVAVGRVRSLDATIRATIEEGCRRSPAFAELVDRIERSDRLVYVEQAPTLSNRMRGALLHGGAGSQYLRVLLKRGMSLDRRVVVLAHELQHAREVIDAGIPAEPAEMNALFMRIGDQRQPNGRQQQYETAAALRVSDIVAADLRSKRRAPTGAGACLPMTQ